MRRIAVAIAVGISVGCLAWRSGSTPSCDDVPLLGDTIAQEEVGGAGGGAPLSEDVVPVESTRLAGCGMRSRRADARGDRLPFAGGDDFLAPRNGGSYDPPPELLESPAASESPSEPNDAERFFLVERWRTPWELRVEGDGGLALARVRRGEHVGAEVTGRAYAIDRAAARLVDDPAELRGEGESVRSWDDRSIYARTGEALWQTGHVDRADPRRLSVVGLAHVRPPDGGRPPRGRGGARRPASTSAERHARFACGGASSGPGRSRPARCDGSTRRSRGGRRRREPPWRGPSGARRARRPGRGGIPGRGPRLRRGLRRRGEPGRVHRRAGLRLDARRSLGAGAFLVRSRTSSSSSSVDVRVAPPIRQIFSTSLASTSEPWLATVTIEVPKGQANKAVVRLPSREGEAWIVGLGDTRAALRRGRSRGERRRTAAAGVDPLPARSASPACRPMPRLAHAEPREGVLRPSARSGGARPSLADGGSVPRGATAWRSRPTGRASSRRSEASIERGRRRSPGAAPRASADRVSCFAVAPACRLGGWAGGSRARRTTSCSPWPSRLRCGTVLPIYLDAKPTYGAVPSPLVATRARAAADRRAARRRRAPHRDARPRPGPRAVDGVAVGRAPYRVAACAPPRTPRSGTVSACASGSRCPSCSPSPCRSVPRPRARVVLPSGSRSSGPSSRGRRLRLHLPRGTDRWIGRFEVPEGTKALHAFASSPVDVDIELRPGAVTPKAGRRARRRRRPRRRRRVGRRAPDAPGPGGRAVDADRASPRGAPGLRAGGRRLRAGGGRASGGARRGAGPGRREDQRVAAAGRRVVAFDPARAGRERAPRRVGAGDRPRRVGRTVAPGGCPRRGPACRRRRRRAPRARLPRGPPAGADPAGQAGGRRGPGAEGEGTPPAPARGAGGVQGHRARTRSRGSPSAWRCPRSCPGIDLTRRGGRGPGLRPVRPPRHGHGRPRRGCALRRPAHGRRGRGPPRRVGGVPAGEYEVLVESIGSPRHPEATLFAEVRSLGDSPRAFTQGPGAELPLGRVPGGATRDEADVRRLVRRRGARGGRDARDPGGGRFERPRPLRRRVRTRGRSSAAPSGRSWTSTWSCR